MRGLHLTGFTHQQPSLVKTWRCKFALTVHLIEMSRVTSSLSIKKATTGYAQLPYRLVGPVTMDSV